MKYEFVKSTVDWKLCPPDDKPEVALIGRSNVGKSSLINMLLEAKGAAKTSSTPGKTQVINHFLIEQSWYLVDLPGYGYAQVSKTEREKWDRMVKDYLRNRKNLVCLLQLVDSRIPPQKSDLEFAAWVGRIGLPIMQVFTKSDKQSPGKTKTNVAAFHQAMLETWEEVPIHIITSSINGAGRDLLLGQIRMALDAFEPDSDQP